MGEKRIIVSTFPDQKETFRIKKNDGTFATLFIGFKEWKTDGWDGNPTLGKALIDCDEIKAGDYVLTMHNAFQNERMQIQRTDIDKLSVLNLEPEERVYSIPKAFCWVGIHPNGEMFCIGSNLICERIYEPSVFSEDDKQLMDSFAGGTISKDAFADVRLSMESKKKLKNFVQVKQLPADPSLYYTDDKSVCMTEISVGDIIAVHKNSDIEHRYMWENQQHSLIRVNFQRDFLGACAEGLKYEL
jgi:hypothetical protein